jgi:aryl-alcohol dehydrogenase-like predicted oxidoreductase
VPYADSIGALKQLLDEGTILLAGVSNASVSQIDIARDILGESLVAVQNQFSPSHLSTLTEMEHCAELGITFLPWSPLGGIRGAGALGGRHTAFQEVADAHGVSPQQVALAWELALSDYVIPIPGASRPESILDSVKAVDLVLTDDELAKLSA